MELRTDKGALWENFLISECLKHNIYNDTFARMYFWKTKQQQEIDLVEEYNGQIIAYEFKWSSGNFKLPETFIETYKSKSKLINKSNFREFINE